MLSASPTLAEASVATRDDLQAESASAAMHLWIQAGS